MFILYVVQVQFIFCATSSCFLIEKKNEIGREEKFNICVVSRKIKSKDVFETFRLSNDEKDHR